jgi:hypothetical protein
MDSQKSAGLRLFLLKSVVLCIIGISMVVRMRNSEEVGSVDKRADALVQHWTWAAKKGLMNTNTAAGLRGACLQVLGVFGDDWKEKDISTIDIEDVLARFTNLRKKDFKPAVLEAYKARFRKAVTSYNEYLRDPGGWKPSVQEKSVSSERRPRTKRNEAAGRTVDSDEIARAVATDAVDYNFPLRPGVMARLILPPNLTKDDVSRLTTFMSMLVMDVPNKGEQNTEESNGN